MTDGHALAMALRKAYLAMHRRANAHLAKIGVTADQFVLLTLLADEDGITQQELVNRCSSDPNTVRAMLVLLERQGLLIRQPHATDGRARCVILTKKGRRVHQRVWARAEVFHESLLNLLRPDQQQSLLTTLNQIVQGMQSVSGARRAGKQRVAP